MLYSIEIFQTLKQSEFQCLVKCHPAGKKSLYIPVGCQAREIQEVTHLSGNRCLCTLMETILCSACWRKT